MGCFSISGFYSHMPIKEGDKIGAILCARVPHHANLGMSTIANGLIPVMAPIYGSYNDYGGICDIIESGTSKLFTEVFGVSIEDFIDAASRNDNVTINTPDNGNQFDNIPYYQSLIKKIIPPSTNLYSQIHSAELDEYEMTKNNNNINATFAVIYEHKSVLKKLASIGKRITENSVKYYNTTVGNMYNSLVEYANLTNGYIFTVHENSINFHDKSAKDADIVSKMSAVYDARTTADKAMLCFQSDMSNYMEAYMFRLYNMGTPDYSKLKNDILDGLFIDKGLYFSNGMYTISSYVGQDNIYTKCAKEMIKVISKL